MQCGGYSGVNCFIRYSTDGGQSWNEFGQVDFKLPRKGAVGYGETVEVTTSANSSTTDLSRITKTAVDGTKLSKIVMPGNPPQWIASKDVSLQTVAYPGFSFGMKITINMGMDALSKTQLFHTNGSVGSPSYRFHPVVTLNSNTTLTGSSEEGWSIVQ